MSDGMRITFVLPSHARKPSGGVRVVYQYANGLVERGHDVAVVHAAFLEPWQYLRPLRLRREPKVVARGLVDSLRLPPREVEWQKVDPRVHLHYAATLRADEIPDGDAVIATAWRTAESVARYPASKGRKHYFIQHYEVWDAPKPRVDATWRAALDKIVIAEWLVEQGRALGLTDIVRIPNAIDHDRFRLLQPSRGRRPRVAMLYHPAKVKGGADGIRALTLAKALEPGLEAVCFGTAPRPAQLPGWIEYFHNPAQERLVRDIFNGSSIYLCPSWSEGWHLPPAEAMACGCAVVATDQGGVGDYARHQQTALLAPVGDARRLAEHVVRLCHDEDERLRLAEAGRALIRQFNWSSSVDAFERHLLSRRKAPAALG